MPLVKMPNGEIVDIEEGTPPEVVAKIQAQYKSKPKVRSAVPRANAPKPISEAQRRANFYTEFEGRTGGPINRLATKGILANFDDELGGAVAAGTRGVYKAIKNRDFSEIGKEYRTEKEALQLQDKMYAAKNPVTATVGEVAGAIASPIGKGVGAIKGLSKGAKVIGAEKIAAALGRGATRVAKVGPVGSAALSGLNQGAVAAAGASDGNIGEDIGNGALMGAAFGGAVGGIGNAAVRATQAIRDRGAKRATDVAYNKIADMLKIAGSSPTRAGAELNIANAQRGDAMLMDLAPNLRAQAGYLKRNPNIRNSTELERRGMERIEDRRSRFTDEVANIGGTTDALNRIDDVADARGLAGARDYAEGGAMDKNFVWNDKLENQFANSTPALQQGLQQAVVRIRNQRLDPKSLGLDFNEAGDVIFKQVPSMRVFDEIKRGFDDAIGDAIKTGKGSTAAGISQELRMLKDGIAESNPQYADILKTQRDLFEQQRALELGMEGLKRLKKDPRVYAKELRNMTPEMQQEVRIGFIDSLRQLDGAAGNPITVFNTAMRNPAQRKLMEFMFDGKGRLGKMERWIKREQRAARADATTTFGGQSITPDIMLNSEQAPEAAKMIFTRGLTGMAYGGNTGLVAGVARALDMLRRGESTEAQNEIARILMTKGEGLVAGVKKAKAYQKKREARNTQIGTAVGKASGNLFGTLAGS